MQGERRSLSEAFEVYGWQDRAAKHQSILVLQTQDLCSLEHGRESTGAA
jgi:hypothetical protein